jgi:hypothetical protein
LLPDFAAAAERQDKCHGQKQRDPHWKNKPTARQAKAPPPFAFRRPENRLPQLALAQFRFHHSGMRPTG